MTFLGVHEFLGQVAGHGILDRMAVGGGLFAQRARRCCR
jgi:hypothetical protein